jgi:hypothetical protein
MSNATALRLFDTVSGQRFVVQGENVYQEQDGKISKAGAMSADAPRRAALLAAAQYLNDIFDPKVPGNKNADGTIVSEAMLNRAELKEMDNGGTPAHRPMLEGHLAIFDRNNRGRFNVVENYQGWRSIPPYRDSRLKALRQTAGSAAVFSFLRFYNQKHPTTTIGKAVHVLGSILGALSTGGTIDIKKIGISRPSGSSWIYGKDLNIDEARWAEFKAHFDAISTPEGVMRQVDAKRVVDELVKLGLVPSKQFESLWEVAAGMNNGPDALDYEKTITIDQVRRLYEGPVLFDAAALTNNEGHSSL